MNKEKYSELFRYVVIGVLTTIVNTLMYGLFAYLVFNPEDIWQLQLANIFAWIITVIFAFITNKIWVFQSRDFRIITWLKEGVSFASCRIATGIIDIIIMFLGITILHFLPIYVKVFSNIIVIILNFALSQWIFKR